MSSYPGGQARSVPRQTAWPHPHCCDRLPPPTALSRLALSGPAAARAARRHVSSALLRRRLFIQARRLFIPAKLKTRAFMQVVAAGNCARSLYPSVPILAPHGDLTRGRAEATARTGALLRPSVSTARGGRRPRRCGASCTSASEKLNLRSACGSANEALRRPPDELHAYRVSACTISALPEHSLRRLEMLCVDPRLSVDQFRRIAPGHACRSATIAPCGGASATMNTLMCTNSIRPPTPKGLDGAIDRAWRSRAEIRHG